MLSIRSVHRKLHSTSNRIFYPHGLAPCATSSKSKRRRIPDLIIVDEHRMKNPHLRKCIHCFKPIRTQNMKAHVEKHKRKGEKPRPDEARRQGPKTMSTPQETWTFKGKWDWTFKGKWDGHTRASTANTAVIFWSEYSDGNTIIMSIMFKLWEHLI